MSYICRRLTIDDLDAMYALVHNRLHIQSFGMTKPVKLRTSANESHGQTEEEYNHVWYDHYKSVLPDIEDYYIYGAFNDNNDLLCFVNTFKWIYNGKRVWTRGRTVATTKFQLDYTHGHQLWPDCLIDTINMAVTNYENLGIYIGFDVRFILSSIMDDDLSHDTGNSTPAWRHYSEAPECVLHNYEHTSMEAIPPESFSKNLDFYRNVQHRGVLHKCPVEIYMMRKPMVQRD